MSRKKAIFRLLDTVGDGSGTTEATGNYASTAASFKITGEGTWGVIHRMIVMIQDSGSFDEELYGNGVALTKGVRVYLRDTDDNIIEEYTSFPILSNADWRGHCYDLTHSSQGSGDEIAAIRWTFSKSGQPILVKFNQGEYLEVFLNDDFSGLEKHRFTVQGHYTTETV